MALMKAGIKKEDLSSINYNYSPQFLRTHNSNIILFKAEKPVK